MYKSTESWSMCSCQQLKADWRDRLDPPLEERLGAGPLGITSTQLEMCHHTELLSVSLFAAVKQETDRWLWLNLDISPGRPLGHIEQ